MVTDKTQDKTLISLFLYGLNCLCVSIHNINMPVKVSFITLLFLYIIFCSVCLPTQCSLKNQANIVSFFSLTSLYFLPLQEAQSHQDIKKGGCSRKSSRPNRSGCFSRFRMVASCTTSAATIWNRETEPGGIQWWHTGMKRRLCLKTEVEPAFRWGERHVEERKRSACDHTFRLTQHKPAVIPFQAWI